MAGIKLMTILPFLLIVLIPIATVQAQRKSFGEDCDETAKCDKRAWLTCRNNTCDCMKADDMMYDETFRKCVSKAGERCKLILEEFDDNNIVFEVIDCVEKSKCGPDGFCTCDSKFYEGSNGTCIQAQSHLQSCNSQVKCSSFEALFCKNGACQCDESKSSYEEDRGQCVGLAGESCINSRCIDYATCDLASSGTCECDVGYYKDEVKRCRDKKPIFEPCTKDEQCKHINGTQLVCLNGECNCDPQVSRFGRAQKTISFETFNIDRYHYIYNPSYYLQGDQFDQCLGLSGLPCLDRMCVPKAYCAYPDSNKEGICTCLPSYQKSTLGNCGRAYEDPCDAYGTCLDGLRCDLSVMRCRCLFSDQDYDSSRQTCTSRVDGPCNSTVACTPNADCHLFSEHGAPEAGHCACKKGFIKNAQGKCDIAFGYPCTHNTHTMCDSVAGLGCFDDTCQCRPFSEYSEKHRKCLGLVGANCNLNALEKEIECVEGSKCAQIHPRLGGTCACIPGFQETTAFTCEPLNTTAKKGPSHDEE